MRIEKVKVTSNLNDKNKNRADKAFRFSLIVVSGMIIAFLVFSLIILIIKGTGAFTTGDGEQVVSFNTFLFGNYYDGVTNWASGFMLINSLYTTLIAVVIALPISVLTALFITRIAPSWSRNLFTAIIGILAAIPSVVYGSFAKEMLDPLIVSMGAMAGSVLSVSIMLAIMILPTITLFTITAINAVDKRMEQSSLALGATKTQTSLKITLRSASGGILVGSLIGVGRALGEATACSLIAQPGNYGPSWDLMENVRLLTATMLSGFYELAPGSIEEQMVYAQSLLLIFGVTLVFLGMKYAQKVTDQDYKVKKIHEKKEYQNLLVFKGEEAYWTLSMFEKIKYNRIKKKHEKKEAAYKLKEEELNAINSKNLSSSIVSNFNKDSNKKRKSIIYSLSISLFAMTGLALLVWILVFLFSGGFSVMNWEYISGRGAVTTIDNGAQGITTIYGLAIPIFGTVISIVLSLIIAVPLGIMIGIYFSVYSKKDSRMSRWVSFAVDMLTGIPSLIYGLIASLIFVPFCSMINFNALAGGLIMAVVTLPFIVKTTSQAINQLPKDQLNGSLALGATHSKSSLKVLIPQILPSITSGVILAAGRIVAESAIFIAIFGTWQQESGSAWLSEGGTTLATEIYKLTSLEVVPWDYVKCIGIVIIVLILILQILANKIENRKNAQSILVLISILLMLWGILVGAFPIFIIGMSLIIGVLLFDIVRKLILKKTNYFELLLYRVKLFFVGV